MTSPDTTFWSAAQIVAAIRQHEVSPVEVVREALQRAEAINPRLNAFSDIYGDEALAAARNAEASLASGSTVGPLHGVPVAIKDMTPVAGKRTTYGSRIYEDHVTPHDAPIVARLRKAGAIVIGKTTTPEFANSGYTRSPLFGHTRNPWDDARTSGGSSGGSAVAVATGCVALAEGTDMGGSVRIPASHCGIVGLKPSLGRIPFTLLPSQFENIAHFGTLARSCADAALFLSCVQGPDDADISSLPGLAPALDRLDIDPRSLRLALSPDLGHYALHPDVARNLYDMADRLRASGAIVEEVDLPWTKAIGDAWDDYWAVYMATFYGEHLDAHRDIMDPAVVAYIEQGFAISAVQYKSIEIVRTEAWNALSSILSKYDALLCPTMSGPAPDLESSGADFAFEDSEGRYHGLSMTCPFNFVGQCPALSVPSGFTQEGLPTGLQIIGRRYDDAGVLKIGHLIETLRGAFPHPAT
ncbi:amidase [Microvirga flavescens]|uniref:amidase n=1 Tax=Microvirga flavescens TaxID=2249811 RepID=UPI000DD6ECA0|nr:amidase [Microvirga flavescens]